MVFAYLPQDSRCDRVVVVAGWKTVENVNVTRPTDSWVVGWVLCAGSYGVNEVVDSLNR